MLNIMNNTVLIISLVILFSSFIISNYVDKSYDFMKLFAFLIFYYVLILIFAYLFQKLMKNVSPKQSKMTGSIVGFVVSIILWIFFGKNAKK